MGKLSLDDLMNDSQKEEVLVDKKQLAIKAEEEVRKVSPEQRVEIDKIKQDLDLRDSELISIYGSNCQKEIADFSKNILKEVKSKDVDEVGEMMTDLMFKLKDLKDPDQSDNFFSNLFNKPKRSIEKYIAQFESLDTQIDKISANLETSRMDLLKDISIFDNLYDQNLKYFRQLNTYILAGEEKIKELREEDLPRLYESAKGSDDQMAMQVVKDFEDKIDRFEKRIFDLKTSKAVAIQTAPQIKLIQNNDQLLVDKITDTINNVIPLWKSQVVIALGVSRQKRVTDMQKEVSDKTNELLRKNADKLKQTTLDIQKEAQRSTIDVETIREVNDKLIETIEESVKIKNEAKANRAEAEKELSSIQHDLEDRIRKTLSIEE